MAFGKKADNFTNSAREGDGEQKHFDSQWMPTGSGTRLFRVLPEFNADGTMVMTPRMSPNGKELREGGKKTGDILYGPETAEETVFIYAWWKVMVDGNLSNRRLMLNAEGNNARFNNPLWKHIQANFEKGSKERQAIKVAFAMNVYDMSLVQRNDKNQLFYQSEAGMWNLLAHMNNGKIVTETSALPATYKDIDAAEPLNQIRILEGSYGEPGGKHLFQDFFDLAASVEDTDGLIRRLPEYDLRLTTVGEGLKTNRSIRNKNNFKPLDPSVYELPQYDLARWTAAWPDEAIERLIAGDDYNEIVEEYKLVVFPSLIGAVTEDEDADF